VGIFTLEFPLPELKKQISVLHKSPSFELSVVALNKDTALFLWNGFIIPVENYLTIHTRVV
jgi:hypothetical protein